MLMQECGLVTGSLTSELPLNQEVKGIIISYYSTYLSVEQGGGANVDLSIPVVILTTAGQELCRTMNHEIQMPYLKTLAEFLHYRNHNLYRLEGFQIMPDGTHHYDNKIQIMYA